MPGKLAGSDLRGAESGALGAQSGVNDPRLAVLVDAWPTLAEGVKASILAMVEGAAE